MSAFYINYFPIPLGRGTSLRFILVQACWHLLNSPHLPSFSEFCIDFSLYVLMQFMSSLSFGLYYQLNIDQLLLCRWFAQAFRCFIIWRHLVYYIRQVAAPFRKTSFKGIFMGFLSIFWSNYCLIFPLFCMGCWCFEHHTFYGIIIDLLGLPNRRIHAWLWANLFL